MNLAFEHLLPVVRQHTASVIRLQYGEEKHVLDIGRDHHTPTLTHRSGRLYPDLLLYFGADDGFSLMGVGRVAGMGHIGTQPVSKELFDGCDWTVIWLGNVPQVGEPLSVAVTHVPRARERQLALLIHNLLVFNAFPEVQLVIESYDVILRLTSLILEPFSLAGNVGHLVRWQDRSLGERSTVHQVRDVVGLIQVDRPGELFPVHHGGVVLGSIGPSAKPRQALLNCHPLKNHERPVHGVQFRVSVRTAVVMDVRPGKEANVGSDVPLLLFLQELESGRPVFSDRGGSSTAMAGRDAAVGLHLGGIGAIISREMVSGLHGAISIPKSETVSGSDGEEAREGSYGGAATEEIGGGRGGKPQEERAEGGKEIHDLY